MASGNEIVVSAQPRGRFEECIIEGTPKPGTVMQLKASTAPVGGRFTYEARAGDGLAGGPLAVLNIDHLQGKTRSDAYASGDRGFIYFPAMGEELNLLKLDVDGTGSASEDLSIGQDLKVVDGTIVAASYGPTPAAKPFKSLEALTDQEEDTWVHVIYSGDLSGA